MTARHKRHQSTDSALIERVNASLTVVNIAKVVGALGVITGAVAGFVSFFVTHSEFDRTIAWMKVSVRANRLDYLTDKQYECDQKRIMGPLSAWDTVLCAHYESQHIQVGAEVNELRKDAAKK